MRASYHSSGRIASRGYWRGGPAVYRGAAEDAGRR
jgi:hypothetical protein